MTRTVADAALLSARWPGRTRRMRHRGLRPPRTHTLRPTRCAAPASAWCAPIHRLDEVDALFDEALVDRVASAR